jgi:hypothetical protein
VAAVVAGVEIIEGVVGVVNPNLGRTLAANIEPHMSLERVQTRGARPPDRPSDR